MQIYFCGNFHVQEKLTLYSPISEHAEKTRNPAWSGVYLLLRFLLSAHCFCFFFHLRSFLAVLSCNPVSLFVHYFSWLNVYLINELIIHSLVSLHYLRQYLRHQHNHFMVRCSYDKTRTLGKTICIFCCPTACRNLHRNSSNVLLSSLRPV